MPRMEPMTSPRTRNIHNDFGSDSKKVSKKESAHSFKLASQKKKVDFPKIKHVSHQNNNSNPMKNMMIKQVSEKKFMIDSYETKGAKVRNPWESGISPKQQLTSNLTVVSHLGQKMKNKGRDGRADSMHNGNPRKLDPIERQKHINKRKDCQSSQGLSSP
jgi:hypothetical protein